MDRLPPLINKMVGEPFLLIKGGFLHNAKAILTTRRAGGLFVLQSSVFRINEKLLNGEQGPALTKKPEEPFYSSSGFFFYRCFRF